MSTEIRFIFNETENLRMVKIDELGLKEAFELAFKRNHIMTLGDVFDKWDMLNIFQGIGTTKANHLRAATHAYLLANGYISDHKVLA